MLIRASVISRNHRVPGSDISWPLYMPTILVQNDTGLVTYWNRESVWFMFEDTAMSHATEDFGTFTVKLEAELTVAGYTKRERG